MSRHTACVLIGFLAFALLTIMLTSCLDLPTDVEEKERLSAMDVYLAVKRATGFEIAPWDSLYLRYTKEELRCCLEKADWIREWPYLDEHRDCDDFAFAIRDYVKLLNMPGAAFGVVRYSYVQLGELKTHAANIFVDSALRVWIVDWKLHPGIFFEFDRSWRVSEVIM